MRPETVVIKQIPDEVASLVGLDKAAGQNGKPIKRSKMPGTTDFLQVGIGPDGRYITGFDEEAYEVKRIKDENLRKEVYDERKALREYLQKATGIDDLSGNSSYWETFGVKLHADHERTLNKINAMDVISYHVLIANGYAAPDFVSAGNPQYLTSKYYCHVADVVEAEEVSTQKLRDKARAELVKITEDHDHAILIGQYLEGEKYKFKLSPDSVYKMLSDYINKDFDNLNRFLKAAKTSIEDLQYKITIDKAVKKKAIRFNEGYYQRGNITLGKSLQDVYKNLKKPEFAGEFLSIQEELA